MKKITSSILILLLILSISSLSFGATSTGTTLSLSADKTTLSPGDTVTLTISIKETDIEEGLYAIKGTLDYDTSIFETVEEADISGINNWSADYNTENNQFIETGSGSTTGGILTIKLTVKENIESTSTTVKLTDLISSDNTQDIEIESVKVGFTVKSTQTQNTSTPTTSPSETTSNSSTSGEDTTTSPNKLPAAGKTVISVVTIAVLVLIVTMGVLYNKYKNILK